MNAWVKGYTTGMLVAIVMLVVMSLVVLSWGAEPDLVDRGLTVEMTTTTTDFAWPCEDSHEIEQIFGGKMVIFQIDWGSPDCRFVEFSNPAVFGKVGTIEIGFRSDGTVVRREGRIK